MDNIFTDPLKQYRFRAIFLSNSKTQYLYSTLFVTGATALIFFLPYYFVSTLHFSLLQAGLLMSFYGVGILIALFLAPSLSQKYSTRKIISFALIINSLSIGYFLYAASFLPLAFNMLLLGFSGYLFKNSHSHWVLQHIENEACVQTKRLQHSYIASNVGLGLTLSAIAFFSIPHFKVLLVAGIILNALPLLFLPRHAQYNKLNLINTNTRLTPHIAPLLLLFLGGLLLSQITSTYGVYLCFNFPHLGLSAMAIFVLLNLCLISWLQKPILHVFNRGNALFRAGCGALLLGVGCYVISLAHVFSLVILSAMILSLGELFFISSLHRLCKDLFQGTLALSLMIGASLGAYTYQFFGSKTLWQSCAYIGLLCFVLGLIACLLPKPKLEVHST